MEYKIINTGFGRRPWLNIRMLYRIVGPVAQDTQQVVVVVAANFVRSAISNFAHLEAKCMACTVGRLGTKYKAGFWQQVPLIRCRSSTLQQGGQRGRRAVVKFRNRSRLGLGAVSRYHLDGVAKRVRVGSAGHCTVALASPTYGDEFPRYVLRESRPIQDRASRFSGEAKRGLGPQVATRYPSARVLLAWSIALVASLLSSIVALIAAASAECSSPRVGGPICGSESSVRAPLDRAGRGRRRAAR